MLLLLIFAAGTAAVILIGSQHNTATSSVTAKSENNVTVFGLVSTLGVGTHPTAVAFSSKDAHVFIAEVSGNHFSIELPNVQTYNVSLRWAGNYSWQAGEILLGSLPINMSLGSSMAQSYNIEQMTPNSVITVVGSLTWQIVTLNATSIKFTASGGEEYVTNVSQNKTFSLNLPNMMTYEIDIGAQNASGYTEWYYASQLEVNAGIRVTGLIVNIT
jgi:hypothetical protein